MFIARGPTSSYLFRILFTNDNYGGFAVVGFIACLIVIDTYCKVSAQHKSKKTSLLVIATIVIMLLTGIKAPVGLVLVGGVIGTYLLGLTLYRASIARLAPLVLLSSAGFIVVFAFLLGGDDSSGVGGVSSIKFGKMTNICFWKDSLIAFLKQHGIPPQVRLLAILLIFAITFFTIYSLPFLVAYMRELVLVLSRRKDYEFGIVTIYATALVGFVLMMFLSYPGHSQVYFGIPTVVCAPLIVFLYFEDHHDTRSKSMHYLYKVSVAFFFLMIPFTAVSLFSGMQKMLPNALVHANPASEFYAYQALSAAEYEATCWLRDNTPEDALIATQMYASVPEEEYRVDDRWSNCHFMYAAYSNRFFYLEGSGFTLENYQTALRVEMINNNKQLFDPENKSRASLADSLGIDYVMVTKKFHPMPDLSSDEYSLVFSNRDIDIYRVDPPQD